MADFTMHMRGLPTGFKSPALTAALRNLGALPAQLGKIGSEITTEIKANLDNRLLHRRTSRLHNSWDWAVKAANAGWQLIIGSDVAYARIHNFGGFTGAGHRTYIRKTRYLDKAVIAKKTEVQRILRSYISRLWRG